MIDCFWTLLVISGLFRSFFGPSRSFLWIIWSFFRPIPSEKFQKMTERVRETTERLRKWLRKFYLENKDNSILDISLACVWWAWSGRFKEQKCLVHRRLKVCLVNAESQMAIFEDQNFVFLRLLVPERSTRHFGNKIDQTRADRHHQMTTVSKSSAVGVKKAQKYQEIAFSVEWLK